MSPDYSAAKPSRHESDRGHHRPHELGATSPRASTTRHRFSARSRSLPRGSPTDGARATRQPRSTTRKLGSQARSPGAQVRLGAVKPGSATWKPAPKLRCRDTAAPILETVARCRAMLNELVRRGVAWWSWSPERQARNSGRSELGSSEAWLLEHSARQFNSAARLNSAARQLNSAARPYSPARQLGSSARDLAFRAQARDSADGTSETAVISVGAEPRLAKRGRPVLK